MNANLHDAVAAESVVAMGFLILAVGFGVGIIAGALIDRKLGRGLLGEQHSIGSYISEAESTYRHPY